MSCTIGSFASDFSEELRVVIARLADWMANSSPPWAAYCALMACCLVVIDKRPGVRSVGIWEMLRQALAKLIMREAGDQAKMTCGNIQLCAGLEVGIDGVTRDVGQWRLERARERWSEEEAGSLDEEEEIEGVVVVMGNLRLLTTGT